MGAHEADDRRLRDDSHASSEGRLAWLDELLDFAAEVARARAAAGLPTLRASGEVWWSAKLASEANGDQAGAAARPTRPLPVDLDDLATAVEWDGEAEWFLDLETGRTIMCFDGSEDLEGLDLEDIHAADERYVPVPQIGSHEGFEIMRDFIEALPESPARTALERALQRRKPFRSFKDALFDFPRERDAWFAFHEAAIRQLVVEWLAEEGVRPA
jgi:hypothetical protein